MIPELETIIDAIVTRHRFVLVSHARPDGDSIGSELALAYALKHLGKDVRVVNHDPVPSYLQSFPGVTEIIVSDAVDGDFDAAIVLECGSLGRTEVKGLDQYFVVNIDHHLGNTMYGDVNWFDASAAACAEMVFDVVKALGVPLTPQIATHLYVAILTDTGAFHHANITERTFEICRLATEAGVSPADVAGHVYQNSSVGKLRLTGTLLDTMDLVSDGRVAVLSVDDQILKRTGCAPDDLEGLTNMPLTAQGISAVVMFKTIDGHLRVSLRSKADIDVRAVATKYNGGGHRNASGFSVTRPDGDLRSRVVADVAAAVTAGLARTDGSVTSAAESSGVSS
jgi:phosphoesterase RecJ-like protein